MDLFFGIRRQLSPMCDPSRHTADRKHNGEHVERNPNGIEDHSAVEIDIRIEFPFEEILLIQSRLLQMSRISRRGSS